MYQPRPMLKRGYQDKSAGIWGNMLGSVISGIGTGAGSFLGGAAGAAMGGPAGAAAGAKVGAGLGTAVGSGAGQYAGGQLTNALDDSTPDQMVQRQPRGAGSQDQMLQSLLRRYGLV